MTQRFVIGHAHSAVAHSAEILAWEETEAPDGADASGLAPFVRGRNRLRGVLDNVQAVTPRDVHDGIHLRHLAEQVYRHDRPRAFGHRAFDQVRVDVVRPWVNIEQDRLGPDGEMQPTVAKNVNGVVMTSSPGPISRLIRQFRMASVPLETPTAYLQSLTGDLLFQLRHFRPADALLRLQHPATAAIT
jgi:hypothetical protein